MAPDASEKWGIAPYFIVEDVVTSATYYRDKLGFQYNRFWGEPPAFCMVHRGGVIIMLSQNLETEMKPNAGGHWDAYLWIENADQLYEELKANGVEIARAICDQEYGCRDFDVLDCNGYRLCFGQNIEK